MLIKIHILISIYIVTLLTILMFILKQKFKSNFSSHTSVECGFSQLNQKNSKFSNQFFMIAILFVIFDMELVAILPMPMSNFNMHITLMMMSIMILVAFSLLMEWMNGLIEWVK